ncbi:MAG: SIMPL domain-containing protein [Anaerolineae bacterium]|nr:SIMPL domain-containing protein [Anaerolineae bacterium]
MYRRVSAMVLVLVLVSLVLAAAVPALAQAPTGDVIRHITVVGGGTASVTPDRATANLGVETSAADVEEAVSGNQEIMDAVLQALQEAGVPEENIRTTEYSIFFDEGIRGPDQPPQPTYRVFNTVLVTIEDLDAIGEVLDAGIGAGANRIYGVSLSVEDPSEARAQAREEAVQDARQRATALAELQGVSVGRVISLSEVVTGGAIPFAAEAAGAAPGAQAGPIAPGQLEVSVSLQVTFELVPAEGEEAPADAEPPAEPLRYVLVVGEGVATAAPDRANATLGVETAAADIQEAVAQNQETMGQIMMALEEAGVASEDMRTSSYSIFFDEGFRGMGMETEPVYRVSNMLDVTIRDLDRVAEVLDAAVQAGANRIWGVGLTRGDWSEGEVEAREEAIADARAKAEDLADLAGVQIGQILSISEVVTGAPGALFGVEKALGLGGGAGPIVPGQLEFRTNVQVVYAIE